jgi:hypothetical protein
MLLVVCLCGLSAARPIAFTSQFVDAGPPAPTAPALEADALPPPNLAVPDALRPLLIRMLRQSLTFRRQCAHLAEHPDVRVHIEPAIAVKGGRARAVMTRDGRTTRAMVQIDWRQPGSYVEHVAHELEHVLEHADGVDLGRLIRLRLDGVGRVAGRYETARALDVGRKVAAEVMVP